MPGPCMPWRATRAAARTGRGVRSPASLEFRPETDPEQALLVERFPQDRLAKIDADRAEGRFPRHAQTRRKTELVGFEDRIFRVGIRVDVEQAAEIGPYPAGQPELTRQSQREALGERADIVDVAAQRFVRVLVARADAARGEAAQIVAADIETIFDCHRLAQTNDVARLAGGAGHPIRRPGMEHAAGYRGADIARISAEAGDIVAELRKPTRGRIARVVALVVKQRLTHRRGNAITRLFLDVDRSGRGTAEGTVECRGRVGVCSGTDVVNAIFTYRVFQGLAQRIADLITGADVAAHRELAEAGKVLVVALDDEQIEAHRQVAVLEVGIGEADVALLRTERSHRVDAQIVTLAEQVALMNAGVDQRSVGGGEAHAEGEVAGRLFLDIHVDDGLVGRAALDVGDGDLLEGVEVLDTLFRALHLGGVEGVALG